MNAKTIKTLKSLPYITIGLLMLGCVAPDEAQEESAATATFRAALVSAEDVQMQNTLAASGGTARQALNGDPSGLADMTSDAVRGTNAFLVEHFKMMDSIVALPPTVAEEDRHTWEGTFKDTFLRVVVERSDAPRGTRFDYTMSAAPVGTTDLKPLLSGHVVRIETRPEALGKQGFGILRLHFTNITERFPEDNEAKGIARIAFRKVGNVHQVNVRMIGMDIPSDPEFPRAAAYSYTLLPNTSGALRWFSKADIMKDGAPYENLAIHTAWRADKSGLGNAFFTGGSLNIDGNPVDYLSISDCWDTNAITGFERHAVPDFSRDFGDPAACFAAPEQLDVPAFEETLPDEDPAIPAPHESEVGE